MLRRSEMTALQLICRVWTVNVNVQTPLFLSILNFEQWVNDKDFFNLPALQGTVPWVFRCDTRRGRTKKNIVPHLIWQRLVCWGLHSGSKQEELTTTYAYSTKKHHDVQTGVFLDEMLSACEAPLLRKPVENIRRASDVRQITHIMNRIDKMFRILVDQEKQYRRMHALLWFGTFAEIGAHWNHETVLNEFQTDAESYMGMSFYALFWKIAHVMDGRFSFGGVTHILLQTALPKTACMLSPIP